MILDERLTKKNYRKIKTRCMTMEMPFVSKIYPMVQKKQKNNTSRDYLIFLKDTITPFNKNLYIVAHGGTILKIRLRKITSDTHQTTRRTQNTLLLSVHV